MGSTEAYVTLTTNDTYSLGALVLGTSLRNVKTTRKTVVMVTPEVSESIRAQLGLVFDHVKEVDVINSHDEAILAAMKRPELGVTLSKLHCWRLTEYTKCVFLDADTLVIQNPDELFEREELSAVPDIGWPDCFNTGVFVFRPSEATFKALITQAMEKGSFDGGDQGLLNTYFGNWATEDISRHLSFVYNMSSIAVYSYPPAYKKFGKNVKIVHFLGSLKPWMYGYNSSTGTVLQPPSSQPTQELDHVQLWWNVFINQVKPNLSSDCAGIAANLANLDLNKPASGGSGSGYSGAGPSAAPALDDAARKRNWESGQIDYLGADSFSNIQKKLDEAID